MERRRRLGFRIADREQRLVERVHVRRDVDGAGYEHTPAEQQVRHSTYTEAPQPLLAAFEHRFALACLAERLQRAIGESRLDSDLSEHRDVADVGAALEVR